MNNTSSTKRQRLLTEENTTRIGYRFIVPKLPESPAAMSMDHAPFTSPTSTNTDTSTIAMSVTTAAAAAAAIPEETTVVDIARDSIMMDPVLNLDEFCVSRILEGLDKEFAPDELAFLDTEGPCPIFPFPLDYSSDSGSEEAYGSL